MNSNKRLKLTLIRSLNGRLKNHKACAAGLGLRRIRQTVEVEATPAIMGMVTMVNYLLKVEEV